MKLLVINGPNLNLTGRRSPEVYGEDTLETIMGELYNYVESMGSEMFEIQTNHEGDIIDALHAAMDSFDGVILNAGAYTHYSYAIRDAIEACGVPTVEVHLSDIHNREPFRALSVIESVCIAQISGQGKKGYTLAAKLLLTRSMN
ncbi:MAG: 3-dehydroquinate dehydratase [Christensenellaceae bacterium]|nr:3-dehydroquinate dehydratase [Christensenellaceae bacterium]